MKKMSTKIRKENDLLKQEKARQKLVGCAMEIIENVIEPLHYPKRGVNGEKYYDLEDQIITIIENYL